MAPFRKAAKFQLTRSGRARQTLAHYDMSRADVSTHALGKSATCPGDMSQEAAEFQLTRSGRARPTATFPASAMSGFQLTRSGRARHRRTGRAARRGPCFNSRAREERDRGESAGHGLRPVSTHALGKSATPIPLPRRRAGARFNSRAREERDAPDPASSRRDSFQLTRSGRARLCLLCEVDGCCWFQLTRSGRARQK